MWRLRRPLVIQEGHSGARALPAYRPAEQVSHLFIYPTFLLTGAGDFGRMRPINGTRDHQTDSNTGHGPRVRPTFAGTFGRVGPWLFWSYRYAQ